MNTCLCSRGANIAAGAAASDHGIDTIRVVSQGRGDVGES